MAYSVAAYPWGYVMPKPPDIMPAQDPHSHASPDQVLVTHIDLDLVLDFRRKQLRGNATLTLDWKAATARELVLDTDELAIKRVEAIGEKGTARKLAYTLAAPTPHMGSKLTIAAQDQPPRVRIHYATAPTASGLQWLDPVQTADKTHPFMFSQSEATHARSWLPSQDSPGIRSTWSARITAPKGMRVIMSAPNRARHARSGSFRFEQVHPVPSYLLAIAAGSLGARETGPRSAVYAEPSVLAAAAHEFADTEKMIAAAEKLYGPYPWGRYDILVLPPSFPFGGMENPNMTFATPTALVGDRSLVSLIAHELAHSWSGNLVTAARWRDIWLNEGVTTYVQGRLTEALYGKRQANEETLLATHSISKTIKRMSPNAQRLAARPHRTAADDELSRVAYDKGSWFLRVLEQRFGRRRFDAWLKRYFKHFAWRSITTEEMLAFLRPGLIDKYPDTMPWAEVEAWVYGVGIPDAAPLPASPRFDAIDRRRSAFLDGSLPATQLDAGDWNTQEWMYFLDGLPTRTRRARILDLNAAWHLTGTPNAEIGMRWYRRAIAAGDKSVWPAAAVHMTRIGRLYLTMPLYQAFVRSPEGLMYAKQVFARARAGYHPLTQQAVERLFEKARQSRRG